MHTPTHFDISAFNELRFVIEFSNPIFDRSGAVPRARVDARLFFKSPKPPPNWNGELETVNWTEEMIDSTSETAPLQDWVGSPELQNKLFRWLSNTIVGLAMALGQDAPNLGDPDGDGVISTLPTDYVRGWDVAAAKIEEEYQRFLDSPHPMPPDDIEKEEKTVEEEVAALEEAKADEGEVSEPGRLGASTSKKARDFPETPQYKYSAARPPGETSGIFCDNIKEEVPKYISAPCERVIRKKNFPGNAWIVIGRDRPASRASGYGGSGDTHASSIDIVVGRMSSQARSLDKDSNAVNVDPDFKNDAARIYISQKCDIDNYFGLAGGVVGNSTTRSGIGLKADGIRLAAREGIKLVTGMDVTHSQGPKINGNYGIDLIANNDDRSVQPIPLGTNLKDAMQELADYVSELAGIVDGLLVAQMSFNSELMTHTHRSPFYALDTTPSIPLIPKGIKTMLDHTIKTKKDLYMIKINLGNYKMDYLTKMGESYINSRYNNVN